MENPDHVTSNVKFYPAKGKWLLSLEEWHSPKVLGQFNVMKCKLVFLKMQLQKTIHLKCTTRYAQCEQFQNQEQFHSPLYTQYSFVFIKGKYFFTENSFRIKQNSLYMHYPFLFLKGKRVLEWKHLFVLVCNGCYCAVWHNLRIVYWLSLESSIAIFF